METKKQPKKIEKVGVSPEWTDKERLAVTGLIAQDLAKTIGQAKRWHLEQIEQLVSETSEFLEDNRNNFEKYVTEPSSDQLPKA